MKNVIWNIAVENVKELIKWWRSKWLRTSKKKTLIKNLEGSNFFYMNKFFLIFPNIF